MDQNTHFAFSGFFFFENHEVYEIMWKKYDRTGLATDNNTANADGYLRLQTRSQNMIFIDFLLQ